MSEGPEKNIKLMKIGNKLKIFEIVLTKKEIKRAIFS